MGSVDFKISDFLGLHRVEQKVGEETVPLNQDSRGQCEPDCRNNRSSGEKFLHDDWTMEKGGVVSSAWRNGHLVVVLQQLATGELTKGCQGPSCSCKQTFEGDGEVNLNFVHGGVLATRCFQVLTTSPADAASHVEKHDAGVDEVSGMTPAAVHDQMGETIVTAGGLAVHLEASFGLRRGGSGSTLLEAGTF